MQTLIATFVILLSLFSCVISEESPITAKDYAKKIGTGLATNYFKTNKILFKTPYKAQNIDDVRAKSFTNLRLRCRADLVEYKSGYTSENANFTLFLDKLAEVVDDCIEKGVTPIVSWINHHDEADATEAAKERYLTWWTQVAKHLKDKSYLLSFNLFTELGVDSCEGDCSDSLRENTAKYNEWTRDVVARIRGAGGKNDKRVLILGSPKKTRDGLEFIEESIYTYTDENGVKQNKPYMMAEWHVYASGPNKQFLNNGKRSVKYWENNGTRDGDESYGRQQVKDIFLPSKDVTLPTYFGAWMPTDNKGGALSQAEVINFARYFVEQLKERSIPWSINVLDMYYDTKKSEWTTGVKDIKGAEIDVEKVLKAIIETMPKPNGN